MTPGRKFSTTTSAVATSRRAASTPRGDLRSSTTLFLPAFNWPKLVLAPSRNGGRVRIMSPSGASILITSAPRSASIRPQCGPAIVVVKSSTRSPSNALFITASSSPQPSLRSLLCGRPVATSPTMRNPDSSRPRRTPAEPSRYKSRATFAYGTSRLASRACELLVIRLLAMQRYHCRGNAPDSGQSALSESAQAVDSPFRCA